jgi:hypothetical protein
MLQAGKNLVNFINGIDVTETKIGEFRADGYNQKNIDSVRLINSD